jgi:hypothetical protein
LKDVADKERVPATKRKGEYGIYSTRDDGLPKFIDKVHGHENGHYTKNAADEGICIRMLREAVLLVESSLVGRYKSLSGGL